MPKVPVLDQSRVQSRPAGSAGYVAVPNAPARSMVTADGSKALAAGVENLGRGIQHVEQVVLKAQEDADQYRVEDGLLTLAAGSEELLSGRDGFLNRRGKNAIDPSKTYDELAKLHSDTAASFATDRQRRMFERQAAKTHLQTRHTIENHVAQETGHYFDKMSEATVAQSLDTVKKFAVSPGNELSIEAKIEEVAHVNDPGDPDDKPGSLVLYLRNRLGLPAAAVDQAVSTYKAKAYAEVIESRLTNDPPDVMGAKAFFDIKKGQLGQHADRIGKQVRDAVAGADVDMFKQKTGQENLLPEATGGNRWLDVSKARAAAAAIPSTDINKEKKVKAVEDLINKAQEDQKIAAQAQLGQAMALANQKVSLDSARMAPYRSYLNDPNNGIEAQKMWEYLEGRVKADKNLNKTNDAAARREQREHDQHLLNTFKLLPLREQQSTNVDSWLSDHGGGASTLGADALRLQQKSSGDRITKGEEVTDSAFRKQVKDNLDNTPKLSKKGKEREEAEVKLQNWYDDYRTTHDNKSPTDIEVKKFIGEKLQLYEVPGRFFGTNKVRGLDVKPGVVATPLPADKQDTEIGKQSAKVRVVDENNTPLKIPASQLDAWLKENSKRRKR